MKDRIVICDIDGTIAIHDGDRGHFEWALVTNDKYNKPICSLVDMIMFSGTLVLFVSGRNEAARESTLDWLRELWPGVEHEHLLMRADKDFRADTIVKREIYEREIEPNFEVICVIDDRDSVVAMWREIGLTCLQVALGDF